MLAPQPVPSFDPSESTDDVRERVRAKLAEIRKRASTGRLNSDSTLFRLKRKLTTMGSSEDVARRQAMLDEDAATRVNGAAAAAQAEDEASEIPDPIADD